MDPSPVRVVQWITKLDEGDERAQHLDKCREKDPEGEKTRREKMRGPSLVVENSKDQLERALESISTIVMMMMMMMMMMIIIMMMMMVMVMMMTTTTKTTTTTTKKKKMIKTWS